MEANAAKAVPIESIAQIVDSVRDFVGLNSKLELFIVLGFLFVGLIGLNWSFPHDGHKHSRKHD